MSNRVKKYMTKIKQITKGTDVEEVYKEKYEIIKEYAKSNGVKLYYLLLDVLSFYIDNKIKKSEKNDY